MADDSFVSETEENPSPGVELPGNRLRKQREKKGLEIAELARGMNVDAWMLEALERDDYDALGAPVFAKGHMRKYGQTLGIDPDELMVDYYRAAGARQAPPIVASSLLRAEAVSRRRRRWLQPTALAMVALAGAAAVFWWYTQPTDMPESVAVDALPESVSNGPALTAAAHAATTDTTDVELSLPRLAAPGTEQAATQIRSVDLADAEPAPAVAAPDPVAVTTAPSAASETPTASKSAPVAARVEVALHFNSESWVEVYDAERTKLLYGMGNAGTTKVLQGVAPLRVFLGSARGVDVAVNGKRFDLPAGSRRGNTARFQIDPPE